ncbi:MAG TPA: efflux RND transporter periplasmic adaptor subunit [Steroidobacteraceae bacterium]|jgi:HlyD family secretion protein|nr:efflux RND transporter periplasmic adaptor subunit [Steroidobacteraceae bacterium]
MSRIARLALVLVVLAAVAVALWWTLGRRPERTALTLYGNVDLRQVQLPFNDSERVAEVLAQEGDRVRKGQLLARLDTGRLVPQVAKAQAMVEMQQQVVLRLLHGNRPQEIAEARANVAAALADASNAQAQYARTRALERSSGGRAVSQQDLDSAKAAYDSAEARLAVNQKALALEQLGSRREDVAEAQAQLRADQADLAAAQQALDDAQLRAPLDSVVRSRLVEPGDISSPQQAAFTLAITDPKWVRAYVDEPDLGAVREGMAATVTVDGYPGRRFSGWIGFISPVAEFTPKTVETTALRSSLVYEVRVFVHDPDDTLRLGMPATVQLPLGSGSGSGSGGSANGGEDTGRASAPGSNTPPPAGAVAPAPASSGVR